MRQATARTRWVGMLVCLGGIGLAGGAGAQPTETLQREADREVIRKQTRLDFNDATIDGELVRPEEDYIPGGGQVRFDNLIEFRRDFVQELETSTKNL